MNARNALQTSPKECLEIIKFDVRFLVACRFYFVEKKGMKMLRDASGIQSMQL